MFKQPKIRVDIFLDAEDVNMLHKYAGSRGLKNYSQAVKEVLIEWRRFKAIALQLQKNNAPKDLEDIKNAKVIKEK